jgi:magnesium chelatase subunit I
MAYEADPDAFAASCRPEQDRLTDKLQAARDRLKQVKISNDLQVRTASPTNRRVGN